MTASAPDNGRRLAPVVTLSRLNERAGTIVREVADTGQPVTVTAHGRPLAVITPAVEGQTPGFDDVPPVRLRAGAAAAADGDGDDEPPHAVAA